MKRIFLAFCILLVAVAPATAESRLFQGNLNGAAYKILVPDEDIWNGVLLLHAHWYYQTSIFPTEAEAAHSAALESFLLDRGYALAGSTFRGTGWQVKEGTEDLKALSDLFNELVEKPKKRILMGYSAGSIIALKSAEEVPLYDGVMSMCSVIGNGPAVDRDGGVAYAYASAFGGWPSGWGTWYDARDGLTFYGDVLPYLLGQLDPINNPDYYANLAKFEFIRLLFNLPLDGFYQPPSQSIPSQPIDARPALAFLMYATTEVKGEIEAKAKGYFYENAGRSYALSTSDIAYLAYLGLDATPLLNQMNQEATLTAAKPQKQYGAKYFDPTGDLIMPVLSVHSKNDHIYPTYFETRLLEKVQDTSSEELLLQVYTNDFGHCMFTNDQTLSAIKAMEKWLDTGQKPNPGDDTLFPTSEGFDHNHVPDPFPVGRN